MLLLTAKDLDYDTRHNCKVIPTTFQCPEKVWVSNFIGPRESAIRKHKLELKYRVTRPAMLFREEGYAT
jgi:hypothetical protein